MYKERKEVSWVIVQRFMCEVHGKITDKNHLYPLCDLLFFVFFVRVFWGNLYRIL